MSPQKTRIAKQIKDLGLGEFDGVKSNGVYTIGLVSFKTLKEVEAYIKASKETASEPVAPKVEAEQETDDRVERFKSQFEFDSLAHLKELFAEKGLVAKGRSKQSYIDALGEWYRESLAPKAQEVAKDLSVPAAAIGHGDTKKDTLRKQQESLLALPHSELIALYNAESRRLAGSLDAHLVDETCKPLYIVKLLAKLPTRYRMMAIERSNEQASLQPLFLNEETERKPSAVEERIEKAPLNVSTPFSLMR